MSVADTIHVEPRAVEKRYGGVRALKGIDLSIRRGEASQVVALLEEMGRDDIVVLGDGASRAGVEAIKAGSLYGTVTLVPFTFGEVAAQALVDFNNGDAVTTPEEVAELLTPTAVTKETIGDFEGQWG